MKRKRDIQGKFTFKEDDYRQVRSLRLTDATWTSWGIAAECLGLSRATKKYDKVGQSWQNEPIDLSTNQVHYQQVARFASNTDGFSVSKPKYREDCPTLSNFSLGADLLENLVKENQGTFP